MNPQTAKLREPHGMCPASVLLDSRLSDKAARVFGVLALRAFGKSAVALSREELATSLRCSESAAKRAISELADRGHIEIVRTHNHSNSYVLRSSVFSAGAGTASPEEIATRIKEIAEDRGRRRLTARVRRVMGAVA